MATTNTAAEAISLRARVDGVNSSHRAESLVISAQAIESVPPTVTNVSPASGSPIGVNQATSFDVTDLGGAGLRLVEIYVEQTYAGVTFRELAYDGVAFVNAYVAGSTVSAILNGLHFSVKRLGGWLSSPIVRVRAIDGQWNQA